MRPTLRSKPERGIQQIAFLQASFAISTFAAASKFGCSGGYVTA
jgi:hypothetical protein